MELWRQISPTTSRSSKWILTTAPHLLNFIGKLNRRFFAKLVPYHCIYCFRFKEYTVFLFLCPFTSVAKLFCHCNPFFCPRRSASGDYNLASLSRMASVCLSVCLSVQTLDISETTARILMKIGPSFF